MNDPEVLDDEDDELARFFAGEDMTDESVPDGGKGLASYDAGPSPDAAEDGLSNEEFWGAAEIAAQS